MPTEINNIIQEPILLLNNGDRFAAFNYNYISFQSTVPTDANYADVVIGSSNYRLYPDSAGEFLFNLYEYSKQLFQFKDDFDYSVTSIVDANQFKAIDVVITIYLNGSVTESQLFSLIAYNGYYQRWDNPVLVNGIANLTGFNNATPVWDGYPFEISFVDPTRVQRIVFNDGVSYGAPTSVFSWVTELNTADCGGYYLKFHNGKFGYSYYLFSHNAKETLKTKSIGKLREQFAWTDNYFDIGKEGQRQIDLFQYIPYEHREIIKALATSNEVYLYTADQFTATANGNHWLEVMIESPTVTETNKENTFSFTAKISLPQEQTRTRI